MNKRVLLSQLPQLLADMLESMFADCPDIELVGEASVGESLTTRVEETRADVLLTAEDVIGGAAATLRLLNQCPHLRVVVLSSGARQAFLYELRPSRRLLSGISVDDLVKVIRDQTT